MQEFAIRIASVQDVQEFVALATARPFPVSVGNSHHQVNGKSFMEMFSLDYSYPLKAMVECSREEYEAFRADAHRFLVK